MVKKAGIVNDYLQLISALRLGLPFSFFPMTLLTFLILLYALHQHRHPGHCGAEDIVIFKGQEPSQGWLSRLQLAPDGAERDFIPLVLNRSLFDTFFIGFASS